MVQPVGQAPACLPVARRVSITQSVPPKTRIEFNGMRIQDTIAIVRKAGGSLPYESDYE